MATDLDAIHALASHQGGLVTRQQAVALGIGYDAIRRRLRSGLWHEHHGCIAVGRVPSSDVQDAWAVHLRLGPHALLTGATALRISGWDVDATAVAAWTESPHHVLIPGLTILRDSVPRRSRPGPAGPIATPADALLDTIRLAPPDEVRRLIDLGVRRRALTPGTIERLMDGRLGRGRPGAVRMREVMTLVRQGTRSDAERLMLPLLARTGLGEWVANYPLRNGSGLIIAELDFAQPHRRLCVEVDGHAYHSGREDFERDRVRQNLIVNEGWHVLRFTWQRLRHDSRAVVGEICAAAELLRSRSPLPHD